jgi:hypothetical protein
MTSHTRKHNRIQKYRFTYCRKPNAILAETVNGPILTSFLPLGVTAQGELWPPEQSAFILLHSEADCLVSEQYRFYGARLTPNPQPGGPGYPSSSGSYPLACPAWVTLPVAMVPPAYLSGSQEHSNPTTTIRWRHHRWGLTSLSLLILLFRTKVGWFRPQPTKAVCLDDSVSTLSIFPNKFNTSKRICSREIPMAGQQH